MMISHETSRSDLGNAIENISGGATVPLTNLLFISLRCRAVFYAVRCNAKSAWT